MMKILLVDDHGVVRQGYRALLQATIDDVEVVEAQTATEAGLLFHSARPDLSILDIYLPDMSGIELLKMLLQSKPDSKILMFSMYEEMTVVREALKYGALGYLSKSASPAEMVEAIKSIGDGNAYVEKRLRPLLDRSNDSSSHFNTNTGPAVRALSPRERDIVNLIVGGYGNRDIADKLEISAKTVSNRISVIKQKLGVETLAELICCARAQSDYVSKPNAELNSNG